MHGLFQSALITSLLVPLVTYGPLLLLLSLQGLMGSNKRCYINTSSSHT